MAEAMPNTQRQRMARHIEHWSLEPRMPRTRVKKMKIGPVEKILVADIPGFCKAFDKKSSRRVRLFWLLVSFAMYSFCSYQLMGQINAFINDPTKSIKMYVYNRSVKFPTLTVCRNFDIRSEVALTSALEETFGVNSSDNIKKQLLSGGLTTYQIWNALGAYLNSIQAYYLQEPYTAALFNIRKVYTMCGTCYSITPKQNLEFRVAELNIHVSLNITPVKVLMHAEEDLNFEKYFLTRSDVSFYPAKLRGYSLHITQYFRRNTKKSLCDDDNLVLDCLVACLRRQITSLSTDVCRLPFMDEFSTLPWCSSLKSISHTLSTIYNVTRSFQCPLCPVKCCENVYRKRREFEWNGGDKGSGLIIQMYTNRILTYREEATYDWLYFCCDLGGAIGLALGVSGLQILDVLTSRLLDWFTHASRRIKRKNTFSSRTDTLTVKGLNSVDNGAPILDLPGSQYIANKRFPMLYRILWTVILVVTMGFTVYQCREFALNYFSDPIITKTDYISTDTVDIPVVTVCPEHDEEFLPAVNSKYFEELVGVNLSFPLLLHLLANANISLKDLWNISRITSAGFTYDITYFITSEVMPIRLYNSTAITGTCVSAVASKKTIPISENTAVMFYRSYDMSESKFRVFVHEIEDLILVKYLPKLSGYRINSNSNPVLHLRIEKIIHKNLLVSCQAGDDVSLCLVNCIERTIYAKSSVLCRLPYMMYSKQIPECVNVKDYVTVMNATISTLKLIDFKLCNCPQKCTETVYSISQYIPSFTGETTLAYLLFKDKKLEVTEVTGFYNIVNLSSDFGGALGLFLGLCCLSLVDSICNVVSKCKNIKTTFCLKRKITKVQTIRNTTLRQPNISQENSDFDIPIPGFQQALNKNSSSWLRITWLGISLLASGVCLYQCSERILYFRSDPSVANIYYIQNKTISMPMMLICNGQSNFMYPIETFIQTVNGDEDLFERMWSMRPNLSRTSFTINGIPTTSEDINVTEVVTLRGICLAIRANKPIKFEGTETSISGRIDFPQMETKKFFRNSLISAAYHTDDFLQLPYIQNVTHWWRFKIALSLQAVQFIHRNLIHRPCGFGDAASKCLLETFEKRVYSIDRNLCRLPFMALKIPPCRNKTEEMRSFNSVADHFAKGKFFAPRPQCPRNCLSSWYSYEWALETPPLSFFLGPPHMEFDLRFPDNRIHVSHEIAAYTFLNLLSDLGGTIGLYFGLGFLQMVEVAAAGFLKLLKLHSAKL